MQNDLDPATGADECLACGDALPSLGPMEKRFACPGCGHVFAADDTPKTGEHTPDAKRRSRSAG